MNVNNCEWNQLIDIKDLNLAIFQRINCLNDELEAYYNQSENLTFSYQEGLMAQMEEELEFLASLTIKVN